MAVSTLNDIGGYGYDVIDPLPDRLLCKICHLPSRDPYLSVCCGHLFCKSCLDNVTKTTAISYACPVCRDEEFITFPNKAVDREIKSLHICCTNGMLGCKWQGELNNINNHLGNSDGCQFERVKCSNECGKMIERRYLTSHVETECPRRKVNCQYCHDTGEHQFIEGQHKEECPKFPLPCPNKCEVGNVPREDMEKHRGECQWEIINCSNDCGEKLARRFLFSHVENECRRRKVNCQYCHKRGEHRFIEGQHKEDCPKLPLPCPNKCEVGNVPREEMEVHRKECPLEMIQCDYYSVGCETRMARKDQEKHKKENMEDHLMKTTNQLAAALQRINTLEALMFLTTDKIVTRTTDRAATTATHCKGVIESSLGWSVRLSAMAMMSKSDDQVCPVILKMSNYNQLKEDNVIWRSDSFYTDSKGYKMCMHVHPGGYKNGKGTYLSFSLFLMKGRHDDNLPWPFQSTMKIELLNQIRDDEHYSKHLHYNNVSSQMKDCTSKVTQGNCTTVGWGITTFISNEDLNKTLTTCQYLKNDCLFFQINQISCV